MNTLTIINLIGALQGIFLGIVLLTLRNQTRASRILGSFLVIVGISILGAVLGSSSLYREYPHLSRIGDPFLLLYGPLIYFYVREMCRSPLKRSDIWHLLPFFLYTMLLIPFYLKSGAEKVEYIDRVFKLSLPSPYILMIAAPRIIYTALYAILSFAILRKYRDQIRLVFSNIDKNSLTWLRILLTVFTVICGIALIVYGWLPWSGMSFIQANSWISLFLSFTIYGLGYFGIHQSHLFQQNPDLVLKEEDLSSVQTKFDNGRDPSSAASPLPGGKIEEYKIKLKTIMDRDTPFHNGKLTIGELADMCGIPAHHLSALLNSVYQQNFFDFINGYRVQEIQDKLGDPANRNYTILSLAFEAGFNSKSSFNVAFKKHTGLTPSEYRNTIEGEAP